MGICFFKEQALTAYQKTKNELLILLVLNLLTDYAYGKKKESGSLSHTLHTPKSIEVFVI